MNVFLVSEDESPIRKPAPSKPSWSRATEEQKEDFKNNLEEALLEVKIPESLLDCNDVHCDNHAHLVTADNIIVDVLQSIEKASYDKLPVPPKQSFRKQKSPEPGWKKLVHPYRESAQFWYQV